MEIEEIREYARNNDKDLKFIGPQSGQVKWLIGIKDNKRPNPKRLFVIEGIWAHQKAYDSGLLINSFYVCPEFVYSNEAKKMVEKYVELADNVFVVSEKVYKKICEKEGNYDGMISACMSIKTELEDIQLKKDNLLVILDGIEIPGNVGTIIRSIEGAGGDGVIFCNRKVRLTHPKLIRGSQCTCFDVPMIEKEENELLDWLEKNKFEIFLLDTRADKEYHEFSYSGRVAIVAGSERYGISDIWYKHKHTKTFIPMLGKVDSLNVAIATTIVLYEASLKQKEHIKRK